MTMLPPQLPLLLCLFHFGVAHLFWLPQSFPPCARADGPPLGKWYRIADADHFRNCRLIDFKSDKATISTTNLLLASNKRCFLGRKLDLWIAVELECPFGSVSLNRTVSIAHRAFSTKLPWKTESGKSRSRRWLQRRASTSTIHFEQDEYSVSVPEGTSVGELILTLKAIDDDRLPLFYSMVAPEDSRSAHVLRLDRTTGQLSVASPLDRESMARHVLKVTAYERGNAMRSASASVIVNVLDVQDHAPVFEKTSYIADVREDMNIGTTVLHVFARDQDAADNGKVTYSLNGEEEGASDFEIDAETGVVQIGKKLDRERRPFYRLTVTASDAGTPQLSGTALIEISVLDANDNAPHFLRNDYSVSIPENITVPAKIATIEATDADAGDNGKVRYSIVSGGSNAFSIDYATGVVTLIRPLSVLSTPVHQLIVRAKDSGSPALSNTTQLTVSVVDVNDHAPQFYTSELHISIAENAAVGFEVTKLHAFDQDAGVNGQVTYQLEGAGKDLPFEVDKDTGFIRTTAPLDRERSASFDLKAVASDGGSPPLSTTIRILITVLDENDNAPEFEKNVYNVSLPENATRGTQVVSVRAIDVDEDSKLKFSIAMGDESAVFGLLDQGDQGALITLNAPLDHRAQSVYGLTVTARDSGGKVGSTNVYIYVEDINSPPYFGVHPFTVNVAENEAIGFTVAALKASDDDMGDNAHLHYELTGGDGKFVIDAQTGVVTVADVLDRETAVSYSLTITARDRGSQPLSASTTIEVILDDVNDNAPIFLRPNYTSSISENTEVGTSFMQVSAKDADSGKNAAIDFYFDETNADVQLGAFKIDRTSGTIRVSQKLDREAKSSYVLPVLASDRGSPNQIGHGLVIIELEDVNDNAPQFDASKYDFWVAENSPIGSVVGHMLAVDPDAGSNANVTYRIFGGPDMSMFAIESTNVHNGGVRLLTRTELDYEAFKNLYRFQIQASSGDLSSVVEVLVHLIDVNDNFPTLNDYFVVVADYADRSPIVGPIGVVPAFDPDFNATLEFSIETNDLLVVDGATGELSLSPRMDTNRQLEAAYQTCVSDGANTVCAICTLRYVRVDEEMLRESVILRVRGASRADLLTPAAYSRLVDALSTLGPFSRHDVHVFSVQEENVIEGGGRGPLLNVSFSIRQPQSTQFVRAGTLSELVHKYRHTLSSMAALDILDFTDNLCVREPCVNFEKCSVVLKFGNAQDTITTDDFIFKPINPVSTFACTCPAGFASSSNQFLCDMVVDLCYSSPCRNNGSCVAREGGYICACPPDRTGENCELPLHGQFCLPNVCSGGSNCVIDGGRMKCADCPHPPQFSTPLCELRAVSFQGNGYLALPSKIGRFQWTIEISIATIVRDGLIAYNGRFGAADDFMELSLANGLPRLRFSLGDRSDASVTLLDWPENRLDDGRWHTIKIEYFNKSAVLSVDDCDTNLALRFADRIGYRKCAATTKIELPSRCADSSVSCYRFLDLTGPFYVGGVPDRMKSKVASFDGCVSDLTVDGVRADFSSSETVDRENVQPGCDRLGDQCAKWRPCGRSDACSEGWNGYKCECDRFHAGRNCSDDVASALTFLSDESYAIWQLDSDKQTVPLNLEVSFRSRNRESHILTAEFMTRSEFLAIKLVSGYPSIQIGPFSYQLSYPFSADGQWHTIEASVQMNNLEVVVDYRYRKSFKLKGDIFVSYMNKLYTGIAPSSNHPAPFVGCIKAVRLGHRYLDRTMEGQYNTKAGCHVENSCQPQSDAICPKNSNCVPDWDRHLCHCLPGFVGDKCENVCELEGVCENGGSCAHSSSDKAGYRCLCAPGFTGHRCETALAYDPVACPAGWFGANGRCGPCRCNAADGFSGDCHRDTGECLCKRKTFKRNGKCLPCQCNWPIGAFSDDCDAATGQCRCRGESIGRRCDQCADSRAQINRTTAECQVIAGKCPEQVDGDVIWPTTIYGKTAVHSCPDGAPGLAVRQCGDKGIWKRPSLMNCSSESFARISNTLTALDSGADESPAAGRLVALELRNATALGDRMFGRDVYLAYRAVLAILRRELQRGVEGPNAHVQDHSFVANIIRSCSGLMHHNNIESWEELGGLTTFLHLIDTLDQYGQLLARLHAIAPYLRPFQVVTDNSVFAIDSIRMGESTLLPKYNNFVAPSAAPAFEIRFDAPKREGQSNGAVFYSVLENVDSLAPNCSDCVSGPVVSFAYCDSLGCGADRVQVAFPMREESGWKLPLCVSWDDLNTQWSSIGCQLVGLNRSHAVCSCNHQSTFAVLIRGDQGTLFHFTGEESIPYLAPVCAAFALSLCAIALVITAVSSAITNRKLRAAFLLSFILNAASLFMAARIRPITMGCWLVSTFVHFSTVSVFAWLFLIIFNLYRAVTDAQQTSRASFWAFSVVGWLLPAVVAGAVAGIRKWDTAYTCHFALHSPFIWLVFLPVGLFFLLSFYVCVTCVVVSLNKEWDALLAKLRLRTTILQFVLLILGCLTYNTLALFALDFRHDWRKDLATNVVLVFVTVYVFLWTTYFGRQTVPKTRRPATLWLSDGGRTPNQKTPSQVERVDKAGDSPILADADAPNVEDEGVRSALLADYREPTFHFESALPQKSFGNMSFVQPVTYKHFTKPDLIPSWDAKLNSLATPSMRYRQTDMRAAPPILSPAQKVLFSDMLDQTTDVRSPPVVGFQTFSPRSSVRRELGQYTASQTMHRPRQVDSVAIGIVPPFCSTNAVDNKSGNETTF
uniref:Uncharacterized protein n=1 Tax=Plectus sambesii TaxID=2011161 RepID=A0A914UTL0_9BILA